MTLYVLLAVAGMLLSVPLFLVFGIGSAGVALNVLGLPANNLILLFRAV